MQPYIQDLRVTYRRMAETIARSERRRARLTRGDAGAPPVAPRDDGELLSVVRLRVSEPDCCADQRQAS